MMMSYEDREKTHKRNFESLNRILEEFKPVTRDWNEEIDFLTEF